MAAQSTVRIVVVHPDLLGTYGDGGNAVVLAQRLRWRGQPAEVLQALSGAPVPSGADVYCLGGGEDGPQVRSAQELAGGQALGRAVAGGAVVLAVCAGYQVIGEAFAGTDGQPRAGLGLLEVSTARGTGRRAVGELLVAPGEDVGLMAPGQLLTGYENHGGVTTLGSGARPLGRVISGVGNGTGTGSDGAVSGRVVGTYLHGPVLARNPALADLLASWVVGPSIALSPLDDAEVNGLRAERLAAVRGRGRRHHLRAAAAARRRKA